MSTDIKTKTDATRSGIRKGAVAAFRLHDGECPVGVVNELYRDYFTVSLFSFLAGWFSDDRLDIGYAEVHSIERGKYELEDDGTKAYNTDHLGKVQTAWLEERAERA